MNCFTLTYLKELKYHKKGLTIVVTIPISLLRTVKTGIAIPVIGAGFSRPSGIANWSEIISNITFLLKHNGFSDDEINSKYSIPDKYFDSLSKANEFYSFIRQAVKDGFLPNEYHKWLEKIPFKTIITTNWDNLIESQFGNDKINCIYDNNTSTSYNELTKIQIIKIHGTADIPSSMVFGLGSYENFYKRHKSEELLLLFKNLITTRPLLFLGLSLEDDYFLSLLTSIKRRNESFIVLPKSKEEEKSVYEKLNVTPIFTDTDVSDPYGITSFLKQLWRDTYIHAYSRPDRTRLLTRETYELKTYLGSDRYIRCRASIGPFGVPEVNDFSIFGDNEVYLAEVGLLKAVIECLCTVERCKIKMICCALNNFDSAKSKGYSIDGHISRLTAHVNWIEKLGDKVEIVNSSRASDINDWFVSSFSLIESRKPVGSDARLYEVGTLFTDENIIKNRMKQFDADFNNLLSQYGSIRNARDTFILEAKNEINRLKKQSAIVNIV